jgi:peroxiredoxin
MSPRPPDGVRAPAFRLPLLQGSAAGLSDLVDGGGGVLVFFKNRCPASALVVPRLGPLADALRREGRFLLAVAQGSEGEARDFCDAHAPGLPVAWEAAPYDISRAYGVSVVPTLFVIDGAGVIAERLEGFVKSEYAALGATIEQALSLGDIPPVLERPDDLPAVKPG